MTRPEHRSKTRGARHGPTAGVDEWADGPSLHPKVRYLDEALRSKSARTRGPTALHLRTRSDIERPPVGRVGQQCLPWQSAL